MSGAAVQTMSLDEFLAWEREQPDRWEFDAGATTMMTGGSLDHGTIAGNLHAELRQHLRGTRCRAFAGDNKVLPAGRDRGYYPDVSVTCSPISDGKDDVVPDPVLVIEVVSPSTENRDRGIKKFSYFATPSIQQYAIVEQDTLRIDLYTRDGARWTNTVIEGLDAILPLTSIGMDLPLRLIYEGTSLLAAD
jgi:Uma2 family endonuclease